MIDQKVTSHNKTLNSLDVLVVAFGAMIGWGWVISSGQWITTGGVAGTIIAFLIGGFMIYCIGLVYAELTTAIPKTGGVRIFCDMALGPSVSFIATWSLLLSYIGVICFEAVSFPTVIQYIFPGFLKVRLYEVMGFNIYLSWLLVAIGTAVFVTYINIKGTKIAAKLQTILTLIIGFVGIIFIASSVFNGKTTNINEQLFIGNEISSISGNIIKVSIMTPFFLFGFDVIPQAAEEIKIPLKRIGRIMILSIILAVAFYSLIVFSVGYIMNQEQIILATQGTSLVTATAMEKAFNSTVMAKILIIGGLCGIVTSWNSFIIGGSRILFSMAESNMLPRIFAKTHHSFKTPIVSLYFLGIISIISVFFGQVMLTWVVNAANFACCIAYGIVSYSFIILRKKMPDLHRPYRINHGIFIGTIAVLMSGFMSLLYVIPGTQCSFIWQEWGIVASWIIIGSIMKIKQQKQSI